MTLAFGDAFFLSGAIPNQLREPTEFTCLPLSWVGIELEMEKAPPNVRHVKPVISSAHSSDGQV